MRYRKRAIEVEAERTTFGWLVTSDGHKFSISSEDFDATYEPLQDGVAGLRIPCGCHEREHLERELARVRELVAKEYEAGARDMRDRAARACIYNPPSYPAAVYDGYEMGQATCAERIRALPLRAEERP